MQIARQLLILVKMSNKKNGGHCKISIISTLTTQTTVAKNAVKTLLVNVISHAQSKINFVKTSKKIFWL